MQSPWTSSSCLAWRSCINIGDEVYLCAHVTDIDDGAAGRFFVEGILSGWKKKLFMM